MSITLTTEFFNTGFEESATLTVGEVTSTFSVHFVNEYEQRKADTVEYEGSNPVAICKSSDVTTATHNATLTINTVVYKIMEISPDGTGLTTLELYQ